LHGKAVQVLRIFKHFRIAMIAAVVLLSVQSSHAEAAMRVVIVGLVHGHAQSILETLSRHGSVELVGICEPDPALAEKYAAKFHLDRKLLFTDTDAMLTQTHPDAVLVYTSILDHRRVIEAAARHGIPSMVEKPLATTVEDALAIRDAARNRHVQVLVNYETTWYASNAEAIRQAHAGKLGQVRRVVVHDGHEGPKEINVPPEFFSWLTDPTQNGGGAIFDFGCYGADLMTVLMHGATPLSVTAVALTDKPEIYPKVEDDATIIMRYAGAQAVLQPSWNWPFGRKDMEVYGATGYAITEASEHIRARYAGEKAEAEIAVPPLAEGHRDSLDYLEAVLHNRVDPTGDLSSLDTNIIVVQILAAARESAKTGRTVELKPLPQ
jgi:glucose-fructose oxidoreductase